MASERAQVVTTPRRDDLGLIRIGNRTGLSIDLLPNGAVFALEHVENGARILINQVLGSPVAGAIGGLFVRVGGPEPMTVAAVGAQAHCRVGADGDRFVWFGEQGGLRHETTLWLHPESNVWFWRLSVANDRAATLPCDAVFIQDLGLGEPGFLMGNEAYASQYVDHFIARRAGVGPIVMSRQNLAQGGSHPWSAHGCLEGAAGFATDFRDLFGPPYRDADRFAFSFGQDLPSNRLQYETACAALQSHAAHVAPGAEASLTFFGVYRADHPAASSESDLAVIDEVERAGRDWRPRAVALTARVRNVLQDAPAVRVLELDKDQIAARYRRRIRVERAGRRVLSFFTPAGSLNRHVVLRVKERIVPRRHGAILRSGAEMLPTQRMLSVTCWMHGVFASQLTIGNTSFHKLFSVSRDPYNVTRGSGLRILADLSGWRLLTVPSAFEMGLSDCRWVYRLDDRTITISAVADADDPAVRWRIAVEGEPCRFLVFGHLVLGEHELAHAARVEIDERRRQFTFRPDPDDGLYGRHYPQAVYRWVTSAPEQVEAVGADELLYHDGKRRSGGYAAMRTAPTKEFAFAIVGSLTDPKEADALADKYAQAVDEASMLRRASRAWRAITRGVRIANAKGEARAVDAILPWLVHDAIVHLTVPHGLEQYTGAAWGTRDVCQGPLELFLALEHDQPAKEILRMVFAEQHETVGDWPQWFMLEPYSEIRDSSAHGDVIVWPLKALCDYLEATGDLTFLDEGCAWRGDNAGKSARPSAIAAHVDKLVGAVRARFVPGTSLIRYGNGDWNDSLQPIDPSKRDWMVSSWTVALLYQQLRRYAAILRLAKRHDAASEHDELAESVRADFHRHLVRDGVVAGYGVFHPEGGAPELLLHPSDGATGLSYSLIPMTEAIVGGLFSPQEACDHVALIRERLLFPDGARLMDRPLDYHGGIETFFRRAESAAFFGREVGLMYVHSHLRYAEAMSILGEAEALWEALLVANPIAVTDRLKNASLRQRNAYFSSSDAAFRDRYQASAEWRRVKAGAVAVDGGWRIYSSGPGLYVSTVVQRLFGIKRHVGQRFEKPRLPAALRGATLVWTDRRRKEAT